MSGEYSLGKVFKHDDEKYQTRFCCKEMHCMKATKILAITLIVMMSLSILTSLDNGHVLSLITSFLYICACSGVLFAISKKTAWPMILFIVWVVASMLIACGILAITLLLIFAPSHFEYYDSKLVFVEERFLRIRLTVRAISFAIYLVCEYWIIKLALKCYGYLKDYEEFHREYTNVTGV